MFDIKRDENGQILLVGRLDASQVDTLNHVLDQVLESCTIDFGDLTYISSAGLGVLLAAQKRLKDRGHGLTFINMNKHIKDIFILAGFDLIFKID
jgi:anti-sigma B factor antagonist